MHDPKDKTQYPQTKALSNSLRLKSPYDVKRRQNVSTILNRLPVLKTLSETQNQVLKLTPIWQQWCANQAHAEQSNSVIANHASITSLDGDVLSISCKQSSTATILKHQKDSLLEALKNQGFEHVQNIRIQMSLNHSNDELSNNPEDNLSGEKKAPAKKTSSNEATWCKPSAASLRSLEVTQSLIKNEQLVSSLKRLAETLKKHI